MLVDEVLLVVGVALGAVAAGTLIRDGVIEVGVLI